MRFVQQAVTDPDVLAITRAEQSSGRRPRLSGVLWDMFSGSAPYSEILRRMGFEERLGLLVEREVHWRSDKKRERLLKEARLKYPQACIEDVDGRAGRGFERSALMSLALSRGLAGWRAMRSSGRW